MTTLATRAEIMTKVRQVLVDALAVNKEEVEPRARIKDDLGAESLDFLDIAFRLEKAFDIKIQRGEIFQAAWADSFPDIPAADCVNDTGFLTPKGKALLLELRPGTTSTEGTAHELEDAFVTDKVTVQYVVTFVERKLGF